jgi:HSF-type DNA-binding
LGCFDISEAFPYECKELSSPEPISIFKTVDKGEILSLCEMLYTDTLSSPHHSHIDNSDTWSLGRAMAHDNDDTTDEEDENPVCALGRKNPGRTKARGAAVATTRGAERIPAVVSHEYVDHLNGPRLMAEPSPRVSVKEAFPFKLHKMLQEATVEEFEEVVSWQPHGRAFRVHDRETFIRDIMPRYAATLL